MGIGLLILNRSRNRIAIVGPVPHEGLERSGDLVKQIRNGRGVANVRRAEFARQYLMVFIDCQMQFASRTPSRNVVFLLVPLVFAVDLESGGINDHT